MTFDSSLIANRRKPRSTIDKTTGSGHCTLICTSIDLVPLTFNSKKSKSIYFVNFITSKKWERKNTRNRKAWKSSLHQNSLTQNLIPLKKYVENLGNTKKRDFIVRKIESDTKHIVKSRNLVIYNLRIDLDSTFSLFEKKFD